MFLIVVTERRPCHYRIVSVELREDIEIRRVSVILLVEILWWGRVACASLASGRCRISALSVKRVAVRGLA